MYLLPYDRTDEVTGRIREYFALRPSKSFPTEYYCTFSFAFDHCVLLEGDFLDNLPRAVRRIRKSLVTENEATRRNAENLISYMKKIMKLLAK